MGKLKKIILIMLFVWGSVALVLTENTYHPVRTQVWERIFPPPIIEYNPEIIGAYFSKQDNVSRQIISLIDRANYSVYVMIYSFTLESVADSLIDAYNRNIDVYIIMEPTQISNYSQFERLNNSGIMVFVDNHTGLMHHKVVVVDEEYVIVGSYNFSNNAEENNAENIIIIKDDGTASKYISEFRGIVGAWITGG